MASETRPAWLRALWWLAGQEPYALEDRRAANTAALMRMGENIGLETAALVCEDRARTLEGSAKWEAMKCATAILGRKWSVEAPAATEHPPESALPVPPGEP